MIGVNETVQYYEQYTWNEKHYMFGYQADTFANGFPWITSLENRFQFVAENPNLLDDSAPIFLIREMIKWGSSHRRDISPKFDDYIGQYCLADKMAIVIDHLGDVPAAIAAARDIPGLGPTYASKLLRFLRPSQYGALDQRIRTAILDEINERVLANDGHVTNTDDQFVAYIQILRAHQQQLAVDMSIAQIEMALFQWAADN